MYLADTNIFLEVLLKQSKKETCKSFLEINIASLYISDFSLHSIGVILFKYNKEHIFKKFADDVIPKVKIITLNQYAYTDLTSLRQELGLDFDDAYQFKIAVDNSLRIVTMDKDFEKIKAKIDVIFL